MTLIYLIRHGQNDFVGSDKLAGWLPDVHLNETGQAQAQALVKALASVELEAVYSSPLERTLETAQPIAAAHDLQVETRAGLGEVRYGEWQGRKLEELKEEEDAWNLVQHVPSLARFPGGESFPEAQSRIVSEIEALRARHTEQEAAIVCVSHADMIKLALAHYAGLPLDLFQRLAVAPASISALAIGENAIRLVRLNDTQAVRAVEAE